MRSTLSICCSRRVVRRRAVRPIRRAAAADRPVLPHPGRGEADPLGPNSRLGTFTNFANLCDMAGFAVPIGFAPNGIPIGGVLLGPAWSEGRLAPLADALHRQFATTVGATGRPLPPPAEPDALAPDETALFCIGAHMSGLPLNHQITVAGRPFPARSADRSRDIACSPSATAPAWCARPTAPRSPARSGRCRPSAIGALLAQVPPPLGFGTVELDDGPCLGLSGRVGRGRGRDRHHPSGRLASLAAHEIRGLTMDEAALDALIDAGTPLFGIEMKPEWRQAVRMHLAISLGHAATVLEARPARSPGSGPGVPRMSAFDPATEIAAAVGVRPHQRDRGCRDRVPGADRAVEPGAERLHRRTGGSCAWQGRGDRCVGCAEAGPLAGVPFAVKNLIDVAGLPTLAGSKINRDHPPATPMRR